MDETVSAKIVANSTDRCWSQAYSTPHFYVVMSIENLGEDKGNIASLGRNLLEKLQREFFSIEEKKLPEIKNAVKRTIESFQEDLDFSILAVHITKNALYIVTSGEGFVALKRGHTLGIVAKGEKNNVVSFSGFLQDKDIIFLATNGFSQKINPLKLPGFLLSNNVSEIAENIAPIIHGSSTGTEAAITIRYKALPLYAVASQDYGKQNEESETDQNLSDADGQEEFYQENHDFISDGKKQEHEDNLHATLKHITENISFSIPGKVKRLKFARKIKFVSLPGRKKLIVGSIIILVTILILGIFVEKKTQEKKNIQLLFNSTYKPAQERYRQATDLMSVNSKEAYDLLKDAQTVLNDNKTKFAENTNERRQIEDMLSTINSNLEEVKSNTSGVPATNKKLIFKTSDTKLIKQIGNITLKGGELVVTDKTSGSIVMLSKENGKVNKEIELSIKNSQYTAADTSNIYILTTSNVYKIDKNNKKSQVIIDLDSTEISGIDTFLGNIYILNKNSKTIEKYVPPASGKLKKTSYLQNPSIFDKPPVSMTIDGSVWIVFENGTVKKYTKGTEDSFSLKGSLNTLSKNTIIYTDTDYQSVYLLDKDNKRIQIVSKTGELQNQIDLESFGDILQFSVDEANKTIYISNSSEISTINF